MNISFPDFDEQQAAIAFNRQAYVFDEINSSNPIIQYKRQRVRDHVQQYLLPASNILELNSGTGEDAVWFAQSGHKVHATDISEGMMSKLINKVKEKELEDRITYELCSYTALDQLNNKGPYGLIFSNFAGLNCTSNLGKVLNTFSSLLNPGGIVILVILPKFCLWESLLFFKGKFKTATRRFFSSDGVKAHIEGNYFQCWYYNPSTIIKYLKNSFEALEVEGLCSLVPPSYIENFPSRYPRLFKFLQLKEERLKNYWPWKSIGDYYIISLRKK